MMAIPDSVKLLVGLFIREHMHVKEALITLQNLYGLTCVMSGTIFGTLGHRASMKYLMRMRK